MTAEQRFALHLRDEAAGCRALGSAIYGTLLDRCADDLEAGGPVADVLADHLEHRRRDAVGLRLLAGVHALVLTGEAPELAAFYGSAGGRWDGDENGNEDALWGRFRDVLVARGAFVRGWLDRAPQTNEVGRAAALAGGLLHTVTEAALPIRLVEIGASAGLNLRADHFRIEGDAGRSGPAGSPLVLTDAWHGVMLPDVAVEVVERVGVDLAPIDPTTADGGIRLMAFVWPDQTARFERLRGALEVARQVPVELRAGDAVGAVRDLHLQDGTWTVLWHSVFRQYLQDEQYAELIASIAALGEKATATACFAHLMLEPRASSPPDAFPVVLTTWPGGRRRTLGTAPAHGLPVTWTA